MSDEDREDRIEAMLLMRDRTLEAVALMCDDLDRLGGSAGHCADAVRLMMVALAERKMASAAEADARKGGDEMGQSVSVPAWMHSKAQ